MLEVADDDPAFVQSGVRALYRQVQRRAWEKKVHCVIDYCGPGGEAPPEGRRLLEQQYREAEKIVLLSAPSSAVSAIAAGQVALFRLHGAGRRFRIFLWVPRKRARSATDADIAFVHWWLEIAANAAEVGDATGPTATGETTDIYLLLTPWRKLLPPHPGVRLDPVHVNSAFTRANEILLFREEEWRKVLVHETLHCLGLDLIPTMVEGADRGSPHDAAVAALFPGTVGAGDGFRDYRVFETYTEIMADLIWACLDSRSETEALARVAADRRFAQRQAAKVLSYYGLAASDLFRRGAVYPEEGTDVFSYHIVRAAVLARLDPFMRFASMGAQGQPQTRWFFVRRRPGSTLAEFIDEVVAPAAALLRSDLRSDRVGRGRWTKDRGMRMTTDQGGRAPATLRLGASSRRTRTRRTKMTKTTNWSVGHRVN